jgi:transposase
MMRAKEIEITEEQRSELQRLARSGTASARSAVRSKMILMAAEGLSHSEIGLRLGVSRQNVARWRRRFNLLGIAGIERDAPRSGRKPQISAKRVKKIVLMTTSEKPPNATDWSTRSMAKAAGISEATVRRIWHKHGLKPHLSRTFKLSNDRLFAEKVEDIVGLYLNPPEHALVLSVDEKCQIQALDRTQPGLPIKKGRCGTMTHDYKRYGTTTLFAALNVLDGRVISTCMPTHRHQEWLKFLRLIDKSTPTEKELHLIMDNYSAHKHAAVQKWINRHPRFKVHYTPTSASWLNMVERFFRDLSQNRLKHGRFRAVPELIDAIEEYIANHNTNPKPFIWTAKASDILEKVKRARAKLNTLQSL